MMPRRHGFSLIELSLAVAILAILSVFAVPRFLQSVERTRAAGAFEYCRAVLAAEELYRAQEGTFTPIADRLNSQQAPPTHFQVGAITAGDSGDFEHSWSITLTRNTSSRRYGAYTITYTQDGYDLSASSIESHPEINPTTH